MKPNHRIRAMPNEELIRAFGEELIAVGGQRYAWEKTKVKRFSRNDIKMIKTEMLNRMEVAI